MRVLAYADSIEFSGAERAFAALVAGLHERDDMTVEAAVPRGQLSEAVAASCAQVRLLPSVPVRAGLSAFDPRLGHRLREIVRDGDHDAVLANLPSAQAGTIGLRTGLPTVAFVHIPHSLAATGFRLGRLRDALARPRVQRADRVVVPAPSLRRWPVEFWGFPADRVAWAPPPFAQPATVARVLAREGLALGAGRPVVAIIGRLTIKQKGHDVLLRAVTILRSRGVGVEVLIAGTGIDRDRLLAIVQSQDLGDRVRLLGALPDPAALYAAVDALVIPSRFEGMPLVALEALSLGVPGVASAVDGLVDVWPEEWLVPAGDPVRLADGLQAVLGLDQDAARRRASERWAELSSSFGTGTVERFACELRRAVG